MQTDMQMKLLGSASSLKVTGKSTCIVDPDVQSTKPFLCKSSQRNRLVCDNMQISFGFVHLSKKRVACPARISVVCTLFLEARQRLRFGSHSSPAFLTSHGNGSTFLLGYFSASLAAASLQAASLRELTTTSSPKAKN